MRLPLISCLLLPFLLAGCASGYSEFYRPSTGTSAELIAARRVSSPPASPQVERAPPPANPQLITDAYAKRGYIVLGTSFFNSGRPEPEENAISQARKVGADLVLILDPKYTGSTTTSVPLVTPTSSTTYSTGSATAYGRGGSVTAYGSGTSTTYGTTTTFIPITAHRSDFGAVYFVKQRFALGAFFRDLSDSERQAMQTNRGAVVRLVVDDTPAFDADLLVGDIVTAIDGVSVANMAHLGRLVEQGRGKSVTFSIIRNGAQLQKSVKLQS